MKMDFIYYQKNQIYFSNYIFNFSSKITIDIDPAYIPIYIRTNDYYFFYQDTEKWIYYYGHSYIVYENKEETSNSYIIVIYHFRTYAIQYQFSIDKLNLFQKKFFSFLAHPLIPHLILKFFFALSSLAALRDEGIQRA